GGGGGGGNGRPVDYESCEGEHRAVSPSLAAQLIHNRQASLYHSDDPDQTAFINPADGTPMK
ncbi:hypothetical protein K6U61_09315, partial [Vibrio vulnificus]|nr:hypothetical protein [Vibrio vulnificus]